MFSRVKGENLFSWKNIDLELPSGITLIDGYNYDDGTSEGSGKSSIVNIICWTIYGQVPKNIKIDDVIKHGQKGCWAEVELLDGSIIKRSRKPNDLRIITASGDEILGKDAKETQKLIEQLVGLSFPAFCQAIYFAQNDNTRFILANETEKANILSEIQDLSIFDRAKKDAHERLKKVQSEAQIATFESEKVSNTLQNNKLLQASAQEFINLFEASKQSKLENIAAQIEALTSRSEAVREEIAAKQSQLDPAALKELEETIAYYKQMDEVLVAKIGAVELDKKRRGRLQAEIDRSSSFFKEMQDDMHRLKKEIGQLMQESTNCPVCSQQIPEEHDHSKQVKVRIQKLNSQLESRLEKSKEITIEVANLKAELAALSDTLDVSEVRAELAKIREDLAELEKVKQQITIIRHDIKRLELDLESINKQLKNAETSLVQADAENCNAKNIELQTLKDSEQRLTSQLKFILEKLQALSLEASDLEVLKDSFKEIKSYVFKNLLMDLSYKTTELAAQVFEVPVTVRFHNEGEDGEVSKIQTDIIIDGVERSLGLLSGGQARRVQLCTDFALSSIISQRSKNSINFRVLDESFKDLSLTSMEKMVNLIKGLGGSTLLIEHNDVFKSVIDNTLRVELRNGTSTLGDINGHKNLEMRSLRGRVSV